LPGEAAAKKALRREDDGFGAAGRSRCEENEAALTIVIYTGREPAAVITGEDLIRMEQKSLGAIQEIGKAALGDKTMVDALIPAVEAMEAHAGEDLLTILKAAEEGARQGMENTKKYTAKFGRSKSLMERAVGHQDAGATSVYLIFRGMREFVENSFDERKPWC
jgi:dihydroxyacetone kinase